MTVYSFVVFSNQGLRGMSSSELAGSNSFNYQTATAPDPMVMRVLDDDDVFDDSRDNFGGQTIDHSQQQLAAPLGTAMPGQAVQSVYRALVHNDTTGQDGFLYTISVRPDGPQTDPNFHGYQLDLYDYVAFTIPVSSGDQLTFTSIDEGYLGQVPYANLIAVTATFAISDYSAAEGSGGTTNFTFTVTRSGDLGIAASVNYATAYDSATAGDFTPVSGTLTFAPNDVSKTITVQVAGDYTVESDERFFVNLSNAVGATIADGQGIGTIVDDDVVGTLTIGSPSIAEGDTGTTSLVYSIARSPGATGDIRFTLSTDNTGVVSAATAGTDFTATSVNFAYVSGQLYTVGANNVMTAANPATAFTVPVTPDYAIEGDEAVRVVMTNGTATLTATGGAGTILNDDLAGTLTIGSPTVNEGDTGTTSLVYSFARSAGANGDITFTVSTASGVGANPATAGTDYTATSVTYAYVSGQLYAVGANNILTAANPTTAFSVPVIPDYAIEPDETVQLAVTNATPSLVTTGGTGTIRNDDVAGAFSVADVSVTEGDTLSQTGQFVITRSGGLGATTIAYTISNGGASNVGVATANVDYSAPASGTISFAGGQTSAVVQFQVVGDTLVEGNEQFRLVLANPANGGTIAKQIGYATIIDNDVPAGVPQQQGGPGNDILIAQTNPSILIGGAGDDTYLVHNLGDVVIEQSNGGTDIVYTDVSYNLGVNEVEALSTSQQTGTAAINLIGNYVSQTIVGNYGDNILNGGSGVDTLIGLFGNDTYVVGDSRIVIVEQGGQGTDTVLTSVNYTLAAGVSVESLVAQDRASTAGLVLTGNEVAQVIGGTNGADKINGGLGSDTLIGFGGADTFAFTTALGPNNVDTIVDFSVAQGDQIGLGASIFAGIGTTLDANEFVVGTAATGATAQIIYNQATGQLFYDADGTGSGAAILFAQISPNTVLTPAAFAVV